MVRTAQNLVKGHSHFPEKNRDALSEVQGKKGRLLQQPQQVEGCSLPSLSCSQRTLEDSLSGGFNRNLIFFM